MQFYNERFRPVPDTFVTESADGGGGTVEISSSLECLKPKLHPEALLESGGLSEGKAIEVVHVLVRPDPEWRVR